jgi:hypothetical membrane protein
MKKLYSIIGMAAPVFFAVAVIVLGAYTPGYSHVYHTISELGETGAPYAGAASMVFIVTGLMIALFGYGLLKSIPKYESQVFTGICVIFYALLDFVGSGVFPVDSGGAANTVVASIHVNMTILGEMAALAMPVVFLWDTENVLGWTQLRKFSMWIAVFSIPASMFLVYAIGGNTPGVNDSPIGLAQRILVGLFLTWIFVAAWNLRKKV